MKRSTHFDDVLRRSLIPRMRMFFFPLILAIGTSCSDAPIGFGLSETPAVSVPRSTMELRLDRAELRALGGHAVALGARVLVAADLGDAESVPENDVSVRDTSVAGIDGEGMLYALKVGRTWVTWSTAQVADSSLLTVADADPAVDQPTYVAPSAPKATVDVRYPSGRSRGATTGKSVRVASGADLQEALDVAKPLLGKYAEEKPFQLLGVAAAAGAAVVLLRPWRLVSLTGLTVTALKSSQFSRLLLSLLSTHREPPTPDNHN